MAKLWDKGYSLDETVERFTVWDDPELDQRLVRWDCLGSIAHAKMLAAIGILTEAEAEALRKALADLAAAAERGEFVVQREHEDVHTAVENHLVERLGDVGKKLHTARSRNDQSVLDLRLYMRDELLRMAESLLACADALVAFAERHREVPIPGRTHFQRAMPSSVGLWAGAFAESLLDDLAPLRAAYEVADQCPLGSAASYGVNLPIDRRMTSDLLGFAKVQNNVLYANNSRGKVETLVLSALMQVMLDLSKLSADVILFSMPEFGYFVLPKEFCPGSSLMPQKRNPGPFELIRARGGTVLGLLVRVADIVRTLPSGYNRDFQETKGALMQGFDIAASALEVCTRIVPDIRVDAERCKASFTSELFATDRVLDLVKEGVPFRDAYKRVAAELDRVEMPDPVENIRAKTHLGATGNLGLDLARERIGAERDWAAAARQRWETALARLIEG